ncbi:membrane-bound PQQ-dependent dehydrogenase, glucose/quinate/shikimate family [Pantoea dispersa]|jgi:quinoprotein glucose dehydrogenase|uniref:membrane-bound PQQ-dependent dehydrogenase, glucose/quinate/shikimate family n=1 Tax=Pantoea dispersa TaxID=59814 RepID=UPI000FD7580E|nr:membrane-bound PQQ-dependent dehydrogenase, glucose/quinate/shikimate family [Pantoea dispersa]MCT6592292.1 membrane-bound PQQ-dependent dehydrogenase, glucose/quinate/shikimate family [Pantoea dispersa]MCW0320148.1 Quinoprotein glucose dehydrogenase [Pantoea dispersa]MCW0324884.1 Quinoprotein glucose dehydrogenase [Pantoea dispersa]MCW0431388.1 Quinoprotein glucose dehydrogenase [Pantoea dispersa]MDI6632743.1 membrane-bound PQQ-dependent dehydrogenase, glucose/quinate/shikimate family [Pan
MINKLTSLVLAILGVALLYMGGKLLMMGGSAFYALMAVGLLITAILLFRNQRSALSLYAVLMWITLAWMIWEVGFDKWQWIPRGDLFGVIGLWLAMPWVVKPLYQGQRRFHGLLGSTVAIMIVLVIGLCFYDPLPQAGTITNAREQNSEQGASADWTAYGGTADGLRFSALNQITKENVRNLEVAWTYHTGDLRQDNDATEYTFEATPLKANGMLYFCTPHNEVHALDPQSGAVKWKYTPAKDRSYLQQHQTCRGVSYYAGAPVAAQDTAATPAMCRKRIFNATTDARLIALDADSGKPCADFGNNGVVDLHANMGEVRPHALMQTAAPLVAGNLVIVGGSVMDNGFNSGNPSGVIRAYDVQSGRLVWNFDPANPQNTAPIAAGQTYPQDTPVAWGTLSADLKNGLVYVPFGNASPDELGIERDANSNTEKFRDALVALDLQTGAFKWRYQSSHHDLWDRDNPSQPSLVDIDYQGQKQPVVILPTKTGNLFVLNRLTGQPVYPVNDVKVSTEGGVPGEKFAATQPVSSLNFIPQPLTEKSMWGITPFDQMACRMDFRSLRYDGNPWTPATEGGSLVFPGNIGVFNWGSVAVDPQRQMLIAAPVRLAYKYNLIKRTPATATERLFTKDGQPYWNENFHGDYAIHIQQLASGLGIPCIAPPWGRMVGVDLKTGKTEWLRRVGTTKNLKTSFLPGRFPIGFPMGMVAHGGPLLTAGDLVFHGATADNFIRAYDSTTGELLWQQELSAGAQATPSTYMGSDGKQYVVIAAGGHGSLGTKAGDSVVAFRLK